ncbi:hypothetical protein [Saccharothrix syringae]|uniref:Uncharacterized protein n=1 Tax=Saccharothrix syringae TaxID=103733 RepID=A0A5Q0GXW8_SACSY|nr:hypothetical protein [Saccharothrix syringae]QFZ18535.1 hypothetical protein EKG83_14625 [Saccharothrix syringae]
MATPTPDPTWDDEPRRGDRDGRREPGNHHGGPLLSQRAAVILLLAVLCGVGAVLLLTWAGQHPGLAIVTGSAGTAGAAALFNTLIGG